MKSKQTLILGLLAILSTNSPSLALAEVSQHPRAFYARQTQAHVYTSKSGISMPYRLFMPRDYNPRQQYPLLLSFHGAGSRGKDNLKQLRPWGAGWIDDTIQEKHPCIILMPQCPKGQKWVNIPWRKGSYSFHKIPISKPMTLAKEILDKILKETSVDRSRIYVMGASMGGYGTWNFIMRHPNLVAAAVSVCGGGDPSMAEAIRNVPIWAFHGDRDNVVPPSGSQDMIDAIKKAGGTKSHITIYKGVAHGSYKKAWREQALIDWVFKQKKMDNE